MDGGAQMPDLGPLTSIRGPAGEDPQLAGALPAEQTDVLPGS